MIPVLDRDSYLHRERALLEEIDLAPGLDRGRMADQGLPIDRSRVIGPEIGRVWAIGLASAIDLELGIGPSPITGRVELKIVASGGRVGRSVAGRFSDRFTITRFAIFGEIIRCGERGRSRGRGDGRLGEA